MWKRAESVDPSKLVQTFVDIGPLFAMLSSNDHQIVYGRRGTGKTHALVYVAETTKKQGNIPIYVDLRNIGSSGGLYGDSNLPLTQRATRLLLDVLAVVHESLLQHFLQTNDIDLSVAGPVLDDLGRAITEVQVIGDVERETSTRTDAATEGTSGVTGTVSASPSLQVSVTAKHHESASTESSLKESGTPVYRVHFGAIGSVLTRLIKAANITRVLLILDEWSVIPLELQPYLADFIRRALFPIRGITVKIAAIEQRAAFRLNVPGGDYIGVETGADASADVDLDDFMVFDNNAERAMSFFQELLFRHYTSVSGAPQLSSAEGLVQAAFTQRNAFEDFVRAAEGVPRDAINILSLAAQRGMGEKISIPTIRIAARTWYQRDKEAAVRANEAAQELLHWIIDEVIGHRRARAFLLKSNTRHSLIDDLFDARVLHLIKKSISAHDQPGVRYDAFKLDYGCYVDLLATNKSPTFLFSNDEAIGGAIDVPPDDYRAIRRAILDLQEFEERKAQHN
jgi:hypothetical protein